jgi:hypothetical protein
MKQIPVSYKGNKNFAFAKIDDEDYERVSSFNWCAFVDHNRNTMYAIKKEYKTKSISMHRLIMNAKKHEIIDHKNSDGLDNTKKNLRIVNTSQNRCNSKTPKNNSLGYKNISYNSGINKYRVGIKKTFGDNIELEEKMKELTKFDPNINIYKVRERKYSINVLKNFDELEPAIEFCVLLRKKLHDEFAKT